MDSVKPQRPAISDGGVVNHLKYWWMKTGLAFFFLAAVFGMMMRYYYISELPFVDYKHLLHAHSHTALLGWGYMFVSGVFIFLFSKWTERHRFYWLLFAINFISVLGMAIFFLYQGYGIYSIFFSTVHLISVYLFSYHFLGQLRRDKYIAGGSFIKWSVIWLLVSTLGLWAIAPVSIFLGKLHPLYYMSVQFFLHFQFNGWFTYAILGLLFFHLNQTGHKITIPVHGFWILQLSLLLTYALSVTWSTPVSFIFYLNSLGVFLQGIAFYLILKPVFKNFDTSKRKNDWSDLLLILGLICLVSKIVIQIFVAVPVVAEISYTIRNYVIGFIHLTMLGSVTLTGVSILIKNQLLPGNNLSRIGWLLLGSGFILMEILLFGQGTLLWMEKGFIAFYYEILFAVTALLPIAIFIVLIGFKPDHQKEFKLHSLCI